MTEQQARENELRGTQAIIEDAGALGVMTAYNRVGCFTSNSHTGLMINILRGEWGFQGLMSEDFIQDANYTALKEAVMNGITMSCNTGDSSIGGRQREVALLDRGERQPGCNPDGRPQAGHAVAELRPGQLQRHGRPVLHQPPGQRPYLVRQRPDRCADRLCSADAGRCRHVHPRRHAQKSPDKGRLPS